jgi:MFS family permease
MENQIFKDLRHNYLVNIGDGAFFGFAMGFASFATILPLFVSQMTSSATLIGLIPAIHNTGWQLPQLFSAKRISRMEKFKPYVIFMTTQERLPFLAMAFVAWFLPAIGTKLALVITFFLLIWQGLGAGMVANAWQNLMGRVIPSDYRATFFGVQSAAANLLASLGAILAGIFLDRFQAPFNFTACFIGASACFVISWFFLASTKERPQPVEINTLDTPPLLSSVKKMLNADRNFSWFLVSRMLFQLGMMAFAFYTVFAVNYHHMDVTMAGVLTSVLLMTQVIANPLLGWIADRWNRKYVLEIGALFGMLSAILAYLAPSLNWFYGVFILEGIANTTFWTIGIAFTLDFGSDKDRPTYVGLANTLIAPSAILAPIIGGWVADRAGYPVSFLTAAVISLLTIVVLHFFVCDTRKEKQRAVTAVAPV